MKLLLALCIFLSGCAASMVPPTKQDGGVPGDAGYSPPDEHWVERIPWQSTVYFQVNQNGRCSAVAIEPGKLLTAMHCTEGMDENAVLISTDGMIAKPLNVRYLQDGRDLAVLETDPVFRILAPIAPKLPLPLDILYSAGFGCLQFEVEVHPGFYIHSDGVEIFSLSWVCFGDSGGPVFNDLGELIGVNKSRSSDNKPRVWFTDVVSVQEEL